MHAELRAQHVVRLLDQAFGTLPVPVLPPGRAYQLLVRDQVEWVEVDHMGGRVSAVMVVPYPPGIPVLMPGEHAGESGGPVLGTCGPCSTSTASSPDSPMTSMAWNRRLTGRTGSCASRTTR